MTRQGIEQLRTRSTAVLRRDPEALRRSFLPKQVRILFIGESPPASGRFFYCADSGLYRAVRDVFQAVDPAIGDAEFLNRFQNCGCYLIDLCASPVDKLEAQTRRAACLEGENVLSRTINGLQPEMIVSLVRSIRGHVYRASANADWRGPILDVPYPGRWVRHRRIFTAKLLPWVDAALRGTAFSPAEEFA